MSTPENAWPPAVPLNCHTPGVAKGMVSITPMNIDMTDEALLKEMRDWRLR